MAVVTVAAPSAKGAVTDTARLLSKFTVDDGCWNWTAYKTPKGYGMVQFRGMTWRAHRAVYTLFRGEIPNGLTLDHLCRNPGCVNPAHLEPVTMRENVLRGIGLAAANARQTNCKAGHPLDGANVYLRRRPDGRRRRDCLSCRRRWNQEYRHRKRSR